MSKTNYFASLPKEEIAAELEKRENDWFDHLRSSGIMEAQKRAYYAYYGTNSTTSKGRITAVGENGNLLSMVTNEYRNFLLHQLNLTTQSKLNFQPRAINTDAKSLGQTVLAKSLIDYYTREKSLENYLHQAAEMCIAISESFVKLDWNPELGERVLENKFSGDVEVKTFIGPNVVRDIRKQSNLLNQWYIVRYRQNKYDLMAQYPDLADEISKLTEERDHRNNTFIDDLYKTETSQESDDIYVKEFWHEKTPALPVGRLVIYLSNDIVLFDGPLPYEKSHIYRMCPAQVIGTNHSYSTSFDLLPLQEALDALISSVVNNQTSFAGQSIAVKNGDGFEFEQIGNMKVVKYNEVEPKPINFTNTPAEVFNFISTIREIMGTQSGVGQLMRGHVPDGVTAGNAMALLHSQSIQFNSNLQRVYARVSEDVATGIVDLNKQFATSPRNMYIVGQSNRGYMRKYTGQDIQDISRVTVEMTNPVMASYQGRKAMSDEWIEKGLITPQQQIVFINTGNLEVLTEKIEKEYILIKEENEALSKGDQNVPVLSLDMHKEHIEEHRGVLSSLDARRDPNVLQAALKHIHLHMLELKQQDPNLLALIQQPALPPDNGMMGPGGEMPVGTGQGQPPQEGNPEDVVEQNNPQVGAEPQGELPNPPQNPVSGQEAQIPTNVIPR